MTAATINEVLIQINKDPEYKKITRRIIREKELFDDGFQDLLLAVANNKKSVDLWNQQVTGTTTPFKAFFIGICSNTFKSTTSSHYRKYVRPNEHDNILDHEDLISITIDDEIDRIFFNRKVSEFIRTLNWFDRELFTLYFIDQMTYRQISKVTSIPTSQVFGYIKKQKEKIRNYWGEKT